MFGQRPFFSAELARRLLPPPQTGELSHGIFHVAQGTWAVGLAALVPLERGGKALQTGDFSGDATGKHRTDTRDTLQPGHFRVTGLGNVVDLSIQVLDLFLNSLDDAGQTV